MTASHTSIQQVCQRFGKSAQPDTSTHDQDALCDSAGTDSDLRLPPAIAKLIAQRGAAQSSGPSKLPQPGQIVRIPPRADDDSPNAPNEYLAVLLDSPQTSERWRGWLVSRDPEYASQWDMVLGPEEASRDPMCQLVQAWNPVSMDLEQADQVLAELTPERLGAVRRLARDHAENLLLEPVDDTRMGVHIARELSNGTGVVTGTPCGSDDPRTEYQALYRDAALWVSTGKAASPSVAPAIRQKAPEQSGWLKRLLGLDGHPASGWRLGGALATLLIVPVLLFLVARSPHESGPTDTPGMSASQSPEFHYISSGTIQELKTNRPDELAHRLEAGLLKLGALPEIRSSDPELVSVYADIGKIPDGERLAFLKEFSLGNPEDGKLRIDIYQGSEAPSAPGAKGDAR